MQAAGTSACVARHACAMSQTPRDTHAMFTVSLFLIGRFLFASVDFPPDHAINLILKT